MFCDGLVGNSSVSVDAAGHWCQERGTCSSPNTISGCFGTSGWSSSPMCTLGPHSLFGPFSYPTTEYRPYLNEPLCERLAGLCVTLCHSPSVSATLCPALLGELLGYDAALALWLSSLRVWMKILHPRRYSTLGRIYFITVGSRTWHMDPECTETSNCSFPYLPIDYYS